MPNDCHAARRNLQRVRKTRKQISLSSSCHDMLRSVMCKKKSSLIAALPCYALPGTAILSGTLPCHSHSVIVLFHHFLLSLSPAPFTRTPRHRVPYHHTNTTIASYLHQSPIPTYRFTSIPHNHHCSLRSSYHGWPGRLTAWITRHGKTYQPHQPAQD